MYNSAKTAEKIKSLMANKGITVKRLEQMCEMPESGNLTAKIRAGEIKKIDIFCKIAHALGVTLDDVVDNSKPYELK